MGDRPNLPDFVLADIDRIADEIGKDYRKALRKAFDLPEEKPEKTQDEHDD